MYAGRIWAVLVTAALWSQLATAGEPTLAPVPEGSPEPIAAAPESSLTPVAGPMYPEESAGCPGCVRRGCGCFGCGHCGCGCGEVGSFNCSCRGSYKFPVPPLYTYHWPGLYSQKSMIEPWKPYRYPPLAAPSWDEPAPAAAVHGPTLRQTSTHTALVPTREPLSSRFQRLAEE